MSRNKIHHTRENTAFICRHCGRIVPPSLSGTQHRNHCCHCLWSLHVDVRTGDRRSGCRNKMEPVGIWVMPDGEWSLIHRCTKCGMLKHNRIAGDDNEGALLSLALRPVSLLPFPVSAIADRMAEIHTTEGVLHG